MIICFEIWADYGHFSHPATIYSSLTYPIPPKTTVMGILGAIVGLGKLDLNNEEKNNYLDFRKIRYSVVVKNLEGKKNFIFNGIKNALPSIKNDVPIQKIKQRKQFYRELLINPKYRIYVDFEDVEKKELVEKIVNYMKNRKSLFTIYMGINLCLANYSFVGFFDKKLEKSNEFVNFQSFLPLPSDFKIEEGRKYTDMRIPTTVEKGRIFGGFKDILVETSGMSIKAKYKNYYKINQENLIFL